jgi:hypothetical protein
MTSRKAAEGLFKATTPQTTLDRTTEAARQIISDETDQRDANMKRLRALRMARDAEQESLPEVSVTKKPRKKKA